MRAGILGRVALAIGIAGVVLLGLTGLDGKAGPQSVPSTSATSTDQALFGIEPVPIGPRDSLPTDLIWTPGSDSHLTSDVGAVELELPSTLTDERLRIEHRPLPDGYGAGSGVRRAFELNAFAIDRDDAPVHQFSDDLTITVNLLGRDGAGLALDAARIAYWESTSSTSTPGEATSTPTGRWLPLLTSFDSEARTLTAQTDHFSIFGWLADPAYSLPGVTYSHEIDMNYGTGTFSYPIKLPPSPGNYQPSLTLSYSSGSVDEMKDKRDVGSWVGIGFSLDLPHIFRNEATNELTLVLNGISSGLRYSTSTDRYFTVPDRHINARYHSGYNRFEVWDSNGTKFIFGEDSDHVRTRELSSVFYYRYDLKSVEDVHGNKTEVTWAYDVIEGTETVRSGYPTSVKYDFDTYNNPMVEIELSAEDARGDNPLASEAPAPEIIENRALDWIKVKVNGVLARTYDFSYNTTSSFECTYAEDDDTYFAGEHTLDEVKLLGQDSTTVIEKLNFSYESHTIYFDDQESPRQPDYNSCQNGNPGTPATIQHPYLSKVANSIGGETRFEYTAHPALATTSNVWTRNLVAAVEQYPGAQSSVGSGVVRRTFYHSDGPYYYDSGQGQGPISYQYRGYVEGREYRADGTEMRKRNFTPRDISYTHLVEGEINYSDADRERLKGKYNLTTEFDSHGNQIQQKTPLWEIHYWDADNDIYEVRLIDTAKRIRQDGVADNKIVVSEYDYDDYGNVIGERHLGEYGVSGDELVVEREFAVNTSRWILNNPRNEATYAAATSTLLQYTEFLYDDSPYGASPVDGLLTERKDFLPTSTLSTRFSYDSYGNVASTTDPNGNVTTYSYDSLLHVHPESVTYPSVGGELLTESQTWNKTLGLVSSTTNANGTTTVYLHNAAQRLTDIVRPGDVATSSIEYSYTLGTPGTQRVTITERPTPAESIVREVFFDGLGREVQTRIDGDDIALSTVLYDGNGRVAERFQPFGNATSSQYTAPPANHPSARYEYDSLGRAATSTAPDGNVTTVSHGATVTPLIGWVATTTDPLGRQKTSVHDHRGRLVQIVDWDGSGTEYRRVDYTYDSLGNLTNVVQTPNDGGPALTTTIAYDALDRKTSLTDPDTGNWKYGYDDNGNLRYQTDARGTVLAMTYDQINRLVRRAEIDAIPAAEGEWDDKAGSADLTPIGSPWPSWSADWHIRHAAGIGDSSSYLENDGSISLPSEALTVTAWVNRNSDEGQDGDLVVAEEATIGGPFEAFKISDSGSRTPEFHIKAQQGGTSVTAFGNVPDNTWKHLAVTYDGSTVTTYLDGVLQATSTTVSGDIQGLGDGVRIGRDWDAGATSWTGFFDDVRIYDRALSAFQVKAVYSFDDMVDGLVHRWDFQKVAPDPPDGDGLASFKYDDTAGGNLGKGFRTSASSSDGIIQTWTYDARGRVVEETLAVDSSTSTTRYVYDNIGRASTTELVEAGETIALTYNDRSLIDSITGSTAGSVVTSATYNVLGLPYDITLGNGTRDESRYWGFDQFDPGGDEKQYGRLASISKIDIPSGDPVHTLEYEWDAIGNLTERSEADGLAETFTYDFLDRVETATSTGAAAYADKSYQYSAVDNLLNHPAHGASTYSTARPHAVATTTSGGLPRDGLIHYWSLNADTLASSTLVDLAGSTDLTINGGATEVDSGNPDRREHYEFDSGDDYLTATGATLPSDDFTLSFWMKRTDTTWRWMYPISLGGDYRVTFKTSGNAGGDLYYRFKIGSTYEEGVIGNVNKNGLYFVAATYDGTDLKLYLNGTYGASTTNSGGISFEGDRVTAGISFPGYDGDRWPGWVDEIRIYERALTQTEITGLYEWDWSQTFAYDANGNMTDRDGETLTWDAENRLSNWSDGPFTETYLYDADGNRVQKQTVRPGGTSTVRYINRFWEVDVENDVDTINFYLGAKFIAKYDKTGAATTSVFVLTDHLGSPALTSNSAGVETGSRGYLPFGELSFEEQSPDPGEIDFTGQRKDAGSGLHFYDARYYDSELGRFISADSIVPGASDATNFSRYAYVRNNPLKYTDPTGHDEIVDNPTPYLTVGQTIHYSVLLTDEGAREAAKVHRPDPGDGVNVVFVDDLDPIPGQRGRTSFVAVDSSGSYTAGTMATRDKFLQPIFDNLGTLQVLESELESIEDLQDAPWIELQFLGLSVDSNWGFGAEVPGPVDIVHAAGVVIATGMGGQGGMAAGAACGPLAWACVPTFAAAGGIVGFVGTASVPSLIDNPNSPINGLDMKWLDWKIRELSEGY